MSKPIYNSQEHSEHTHELLEVIRLLERQHHSFGRDTDEMTAHAQKTDGTPFDKLVQRAQLIDHDHALQDTLAKQHRHFALLGVGLSWVSFVLGAVASFGFLQGQWVNFFYLLLALLGWHSISLLLWLIGGGQKFGAPLIAGAVANVLDTDRLQITNTQDAPANPSRIAKLVFLGSLNQKRRWVIGKLVHRAWIFSLLGSVSALFLLFLSKSYVFVWESTLLGKSHIDTIVQIIGIVPSWFGFDLPNQDTLLDPTKLAILLMLSIVLYGIVPRLIAYLYCHWQASRTRFHIDRTIYYYEHLLRQFNQQITDADDYVAPVAQPAQAKLSTEQKIVLSFEWLPEDPFWYQFGAGANVLDFGGLDDDNDFMRLSELLNSTPLSLYVGIDNRILPDRGVVRKFEKLLALAKHGMVVELIGKPNTHHYALWQEILVKYRIDEVRYH